MATGTSLPLPAASVNPYPVGCLIVPLSDTVAGCEEYTATSCAVMLEPEPGPDVTT